MEAKIIEMFLSGENFEVKWVEVKRRGHSIGMKQCTGKIIAINGKTATVKRRGKTTSVALSELRLESEKGQLTEFVENLAAAK